MLRVVASAIQSSGKNLLIKNVKSVSAVSSNKYSSIIGGGHGHHEHISDEESDKKFVSYLNRPDIDGWEVRKAMNDLCGLDHVPEPEIIIAALRACRRINDYALGVRFIEAVKYKCAHRVKEIYPYVIQEIKPTLDELGLDTPEDLGYDKPELALVDVDDIH